MGEDIEKMMTTEVIHDFKNILTGILGNLAIAKDWSNPEDQAYPFIEAAERVARHANQLALQMLANAKGGERELVEVSMARLVRDAVDMMIGGSSCSSKVVIDSDLCLVHGDETRLMQVLNNLLVNAKQAMPKGGVVTVRLGNLTVTEQSQYRLRPGRYVRVSVEDHGVGIPEQNLTQIFKMHFTTKKEGTGIGLASCIYIIKKHGGTIHVESEEGQGSTFTLLLPALDKLDSEVTPQPSKPVDGSGCILVMDDEAMVQQALGDMLGVFGFDVEFADDGEHAIENYQRAMDQGKPYRLVIMDLTIPGGMGGVETVRRLREIDPEVKAVVSSGHANDPAMLHCRDFGFSGSIQKPYSLKDLQKLVATILNPD